jgi:CrcB protein
MRLLWVAVGGALGSCCRYLLDGAVYRVLPATFPYGTFVVNFTGCLVFGLVLGAAENRLAVGTVARSFVLIGILGGFTTFSSFAFESLQLARAGDWWPATVNVVGQVTLGLLVMWAGIVLTRLVWP